MMVDTYKSMKIMQMNPSQNDAQAYFKILDRDNDNRVTIHDIEDLAIKYLCGEGNLSFIDYSPTYQ